MYTSTSDGLGSVIIEANKLVQLRQHIVQPRFKTILVYRSLVSIAYKLSDAKHKPQLSISHALNSVNTTDDQSPLSFMFCL